jgi:hypothetical protein
MMQDLSDLIQDVLVTLPADKEQGYDEYETAIPSTNRINQIKYCLNLLTRLNRRLTKNYPQARLNPY